MSKTKKRIRAIRKLNAKFHRMMELKDRLIDGMQANCPHPACVETAKVVTEGPSLMAGKTMRTCMACGTAAVLNAADPKGYFGVLTRSPRVQHLEPAEFRAAVGRIIRRIGINL